jgi:2-polyprenyl-3-methyl-5-hydroxy-6-metoxy-1,4-benzoquinol methylase
MDQPELDASEHGRALAGLARINRLSRSDAILWPAIKRLARAAQGSAIRVLDLATGGGDVPLSLARRARRAGLEVSIEGCDKSPRAVGLAERHANLLGYPVHFFTLDVLNEPIPKGFDVILCSLFLHHLDETSACSFLRNAAAASRRLLLVNDLERGPMGYALAWAGCRLITASRVARHDGLVSVAGSFTLAEARLLAERAGLAGAHLARCWPCRFLLSWSR